MKKKSILTVVIVGIVVLIGLCGVITLLFGGATSMFFTAFIDSGQTESSWREVEIPVSDYEGEVLFMAKPAHPFLAEYDYKMKISLEDEVKEFTLPMNTGGSVNQIFYMNRYDGRNYIETAQTLIDLEDLLKIHSIEEKDYPEHADDRRYYNIRIKGDRSLIGRVTWDKKLVFSTKAQSELLISKEILWGDWVALSDDGERVRAGVEKGDSPEYLDCFVEISNGDEERIFRVNTSFNKYKFSLNEYQYEGYTYIVMGDRIKNVFNVESLIEIHNRSVSGFDNTQQQQELWVESAYLSDILENGDQKLIGEVEYEVDGARISPGT